MQRKQIEIERIQKAAALMAKLWADSPSSQDHKRSETWRAADPDNEKAWQCLIEAQSHFDDAPTKTTSIITHSDKLKRRQFLSLIALSAGSIFLFNNDTINDLISQSEQQKMATTTGEIKHIKLDEHTQLSLNTDTEVNFLTERHLVIESGGECYLSATQKHPFHLTTPNGKILFTQGEMNIRCTDDVTKISVFSGQEIQYMGQKMPNFMALSAGNSVSFNHQNASQITHSDINSIGWLTGKLMAQNMPLGDFLYELNRYRKGLMRISPELNTLHVSGVFSLNEPDTILQQLAATFPIKVQFFTPFLANISIS
ncbi:FecR domain-containing protein [Marinomonas sp. TW1]|uniref:FecR domain-containing protein n=1 Tax=Marinomonas sp. TW1 TaxID=1561203 RepID=UPI0007AF99A6|nr:FecR domain-containing protein [Marinomonas sp. TW1]KZN12504.1 hypothetical protein OA79_16255 [Marinomonas sp. TW1]